MPDQPAEPQGADPTGATITWDRMLAEVARRVGDRARARWLCETASGCHREEFAAILGERVGEREGRHLERMIARCEAGEPLQYVLGRWGFRRLDLMVDRRVLIPRPETELIVEVVLGHLAAARSSEATTAARGAVRPAVVADLGTGSGAIGLSVLAESPPDSVEVWMTDASADALDVARANAAGIGRAAVGARFAVGSWWEALPDALRGRLEVVVSNPPYVASDDPELDDEVREWEPAQALWAGPDGLDAVRRIVDEAGRWLAPGGMLAIEIGHRQAAAVRALLAAAGLTSVELRRDLVGRDRIVTAVSATPVRGG